MTFWFVGSTGAVLWTCYWLFAIFYTRSFNRPFFFLMPAFGAFITWEGFKAFREAKKTR